MLTLRLEDANTALAEKDRLNSELQQEKATLKVQVGKWKSLGDHGGVEVEELHKQRATLKSQVEHLESRVTEEQHKALAHEKALQKEHKKIEKLQEALEEQTRIAEEAKAIAEANRRDGAGDARMNKKLQKLTAALEEQAEKAVKAEEEASLLEEQSRCYKDELDKALSQIEKLRATLQLNGSTSRSRALSGHTSDEVEIIKRRQSEVSHPPAVESSHPNQKVASNNSLIPVKEPNGNAKKTSKKPDKGKDSQKSRMSTSDYKGKRKELPDDDGITTIESVGEANSKAQRGQTKGKEPQPAADASRDRDDIAVPKRKKRRKLNVNPFASAKPASLDWANQFNLVEA
ncbi:hypothetical protein B0F90DRAFT_1320307 [Multifurca ochricompacta]|uniref:Uncharacterized protein n=1 Tax=Multifurca ochricompacta TaxID=376703 RepID=A0AAD4QPZ9_9AGAM|nr:hypothetical protein B0F90DRAFT_1320307 [Multifurca ochricompacta]